MILVSGVRRRGTQLAATPRHVIDRPELYLAKRLYDVSLSGKTPVGVSLVSKNETTEYPANGSPILRSTRVDREVSEAYASER